MRLLMKQAHITLDDRKVVGAALKKAELTNGPAAAMEFGYAIAEHFLGKDAVAPLREGMIYNQLFKQMLVDVYKGF